MITENVLILKINYLTQEQYDREKKAGNIDENALYLTPEGEYVTPDELSEALSKVLHLSGGTMTGTLIVNGGDAVGSSKIVLATGKGNITDNGTATLFGFITNGLAIGHGSYNALLRGKAARPTYNGNDMALYGDIPTDYAAGSHNHNVSDISDLTATAVELNYMSGVTSKVQTQLNKKANDYSIEIYNGTSGNPKPVKFMTVDYSTCGSENGVAIKVGMVSGHGNGSSYAFLQDAIIKVTHTGTVTVDNFKYYGASTGTYDGASRQYGDIFWVIDTTNKIVDFYCLMGQYARLQMIPYKRVTYSTGGTITQYTSATVYSSGDKVWGNNSEFALMSDIPTTVATTSTNGLMSAEDKANLDALVASAISVFSGTATPTADVGIDGDVYLVTE